MNEIERFEVMYHGSGTVVCFDEEVAELEREYEELMENYQDLLALVHKLSEKANG